MKELNNIAMQLSNRIAGQMDAHLVESIISLFNEGVLVHHVRSPRTTLDMNNMKMTIDAANGVTFEGREKLIKAEKLIEEQAIKIQELKTELSNLADEYRWEQEVKNAWKSKFQKLEADLVKLVKAAGLQ